MVPSHHAWIFASTHAGCCALPNQLLETIKASTARVRNTRCRKQQWKEALLCSRPWMAYLTWLPKPKPSTCCIILLACTPLSINRTKKPGSSHSQKPDICHTPGQHRAMRSPSCPFLLTVGTLRQTSSPSPTGIYLHQGVGRDTTTFQLGG